MATAGINFKAHKAIDTPGSLTTQYIGANALIRETL
jgi:ethanolamine utilization protein EutP (predicted NTPase)